MLLFFQSSISKLVIQDVPHGIVTNKEPVRTSTAMYHLVVVFGDPETSGDDAITREIQEIQKTITEKGEFSGSDFILTRLNQIQNQYTGLTRTRRPKRGLINFIGDYIGKGIFGLGTEKDIQELKNIIEDNRDSLSSIVHKNNRLVSIVNATKYEMSENRQAINQLTEATKLLSKWVKETRLRQHIYKGLMFKVEMLQEYVNHVRRVKDKVLRMRKDLERGFLSEELLPPDSLESLRNSPLIPTGTDFIKPLLWYYSGLKVRLVSIDDELVYSVNLPLVSTEPAMATKFLSFPTPNINKNVTIQVEVEGSSLLNGLTGQVTDITNQCFGTNPMVCPPMPVRRDNLAAHSCKAALLRNVDVIKYCPVQITRNTQDQFFYHDINSFILVTWGTDIVEECLHSETISLSAGTYMLEWEGECSLCTKHHCIPGTIQTGSTLRLNNTWRPISIPEIKSFSELKLSGHLSLPSKLSETKMVQLNELLMDSPPSIEWSSNETSLTIDVIVICIVVAIVIVVMLAYYRYGHTKLTGKEKLYSESVNTTPVNTDQIIPLVRMVNQPEIPLEVSLTSETELYPATCVIKQ